MPHAGGSVLMRRALLRCWLVKVASAMHNHTEVMRTGGRRAGEIQSP